MTKGRPATIGETRLSPNGYMYVRRAEGWKLVHREVVEQDLGRKLEKTERIRFKDNDRTNTSRDNLIVINVKPKSKDRRKAELESRIADLQAQLADLEQS